MYTVISVYRKVTNEKKQSSKSWHRICTSQPWHNVQRTKTVDIRSLVYV